VIGRTLSSYRVVEKLGGGGMGEVYLARDERLGRDVALKILPEGRLRDESARSRFRKEAQALLRLSHPHVATLLDFGSADGTVSCVGLRGQAADLRRAEHLEVDVGVVALLSTLRRKPSAAERQGEEG
jgi:serine/threonine protein kinase